MEAVGEKRKSAVMIAPVIQQVQKGHLENKGSKSVFTKILCFAVPLVGFQK
jgi:hypothetical protein